MFCKVMTIDEASREETVYQCDRVACNFVPGRENDFRLHIMLKGGNHFELEFGYADYKSVQVFLMNDDGQTIDRHGWRK